MRHRHIVPDGLTLAAIDDIIARGLWQDWAELRKAARRNPSVRARIERVCAAQINDPGAQRHRFWMLYASELAQSS